MMNHITIVMPFYNNGGMLLEHLKHWKKYPKRIADCFNAIIVDDGSPRTPAKEYLKGDFPFPIQLYRIIPDIPWN